MMTNKDKLQKTLQECDKHIVRMQYAYAQIKGKLPLNSLSLSNLSNAGVQTIDQFLFRFAKLQDTMGEKLFKILLLNLDEEVDNKPFIDILNRLEKLELLNADVWRNLRNISNELSHNYDDDLDYNAISLNKIFINQEQLLLIYQNIKNYVSKT